MIDSVTFSLILALAVAASLISLKVGISVAIIEILVGIAIGNAIGINPSDHDWLLFLAGLGSVVLTFLAGAEIDPEAMRKTWKVSVTIGMLSFLVPFLGCWWFSYLVLGWTWGASLLTGVALSTTSVAVVYVVLLETGLSKTATGKVILSSCFITDLGTAIALSVLFTGPNPLFFVVIAAIGLLAWLLPKYLDQVLRKLRGRTGEPSVKIVLLLVIALGALAEQAGIHAILPAYVLGLIMASLLSRNKDLLMKLRTLALAFLTPFFFIVAGMNVSAISLISGGALILVLFFMKVGTKFIGVLPASMKLVRKDSVYLTLLMSTGLTFGTISAQFGYANGLIDREQFSIIVMVVILTAIIPTIIAQRFFDPRETGDA
jgi:Kef-type K+ transport system membrane component KefB